ncbi:MAG: TldD/PmbA family protein [Desulfitobacterium hafniense]|nr:TldD/PmbA family protein [Desulfitobacterium hafniense]
MKELVRRLLGEKIQGYVIIRVQLRREWGIRFANGRIERVSTGWDSGIGIQAFTENGVCGFASADILSEEVGLAVLERAMKLARRNEELGADKNRKIFDAPVVIKDVPSEAKHPFEEMSLSELQERVAYLHKRLSEKRQDVVWQTSYRQVEDSWCIGRSDGTLIAYTVPRAVLMHQGTVKVNQKAQSLLVHRSGTDLEILLAEKADQVLEKQASERADFARAVCLAPPLPAGHYPLIIDYGLAKGLAHEAFGHAVESDHINESVLGDNGKLKRGLKVAREGVHIIDGPLNGDWAYQPFSANGLERKTVEIVRNGILEAGLGDIFSAEEAGMPVTGAGRAEGYSYVPLPRMTNIRLLVDNVLPLSPNPKLMDEVKNLRQTLVDHGELEQDNHLLLLGYRGGQVNPKTGDFVFQCDGIINLADPNLPVYQPSIFSGKILSALKAIKLGLGQGCFNAIGTCGKRGQAVPSSGGSHMYLLLEADKEVSLGGES